MERKYTTQNIPHAHYNVYEEMASSSPDVDAVVLVRGSLSWNLPLTQDTDISFL